MEAVAVWRPRHLRTRRRPVLHAAKDHHRALANGHPRGRGHEHANFGLIFPPMAKGVFPRYPRPWLGDHGAPTAVLRRASAWSRMRSAMARLVISGMSMACSRVTK